MVHSDTTQRDRLARRARVYRATVVAMVVASLATIVVTAWALLIQNQKITELAKLNKANSDLLVQCTTAPGDRRPPVDTDDAADCYVRSQRQTGRVVSNISSISIAAAACGAAHPGDVKATEACVNATLAREETK